MGLDKVTDDVDDITAVHFNDQLDVIEQQIIEHHGQDSRQYRALLELRATIPKAADLSRRGRLYGPPGNPSDPVRFQEATEELECFNQEIERIRTDLM